MLTSFAADLKVGSRVLREPKESDRYGAEGTVIENNSLLSGLVIRWENTGRSEWVDYRQMIHVHLLIEPGVD
jgi:hypothetical protein